jgi:CheY-like chemotaxis protein
MHPDRRTRPRPQRVLVVEDTADLREMWRQWLQFLNFEVAEAENGAEAVRRARLQRPDVVLMDMWLPVLDGLEATRQIRAEESLADVPIIVVTAQNSGRAAERARESGCTRFVVKPVSPEELLGHIRAVLREAPPARQSSRV